VGLGIKKIIDKYQRLVLGENRFAPLRKRLFVISVWVSVLLAVLGNIANILMGLPTELLVITSVIIAVLSLIYLKIRISPQIDYEKYVYIFWGTVLLVIPTVWIYNSGNDSNLVMMNFVVFFSMYLTVKPVHRFATFIAFIFIIIGLVLLDYYFPEVIVRYTNPEQRIVDLVFGYALYLTLSYSLLNTIIKNSDYEQAKLSLRNKQLDELSKQTVMLNKKLEITVAELEQSNYSKDRFISIIAHDLRSPFQGLLGVSRLLAAEYNELEENERIELIDKLDQSLERQYNFLEELLLWGRIQRNAVQILIESMDVLKLIHNIIEILKEAADRKKINFQITPCQDFTINTDKNLLATVIRNIISNAVKFSTFGSKIEISLVYKELFLMVSIKDFGIGMNDNDLRKLFKVEEHLTRRGTDGEVGTGLGLIVTHEIVTKLNGYIRVKSKEAEGTTFELDLPLNHS